MKRWLAVLLAGVFLFAAAGCDGDGRKAVSSAADGAVDCAFEAQYIRTDGYHDNVEYPVITRISSKVQLEDYYEANKELYAFGHREKIYADSTIGFVDAMEKYDDAFFEERMLVLILLEETSGSNRHKVTSVTTENGVTTITVNRYSPEEQTCDMAEWHIFVELRCDQAGSELKTEISEKTGTMEEYEASN